MTSFSVNNKPLGKAMYMISKREKTGMLCPVKIDATESLQEKILKALVISMIRFDSKERPTITVVLEELKVIDGM